MQDEHFFRHWNEGHADFSAEIDRLLTKLFGRRADPADGIGKPYASQAHAPRDPIGDAGNSLVGGLAAVITTLALFVTVGALALPASADAASGQLALASVFSEGLLL